MSFVRVFAMGAALLLCTACAPDGPTDGTAERPADNPRPSVGRGAPDPLVPETIVGPDGRGLFVGPEENPNPYVAILAAANGDVPAGMQPLAVDIFTTNDFYQDRDLWSDPRYFRCNAPQALEAQWGTLEFPTIGDDPPASAAWGYCDRDYPRSEIVSPYPFATAKAHYEALLDETKAGGGPTIYTRSTLPDWDGIYERNRAKTVSWYYGATLQVPTYLALLTPEYQTRLVQQMYHYAATNAPQWPGSYCQPEGFMRRFAQYATTTPRVMMTPELVQILNDGVKNFITHIHIGREFTEDGPVPHLGPAVARWYGETIGFWDREALITWTSNIQGWFAHGAHEHSNALQTIEIYTPRTSEDGELLGLRHEAVLYDPEAFVEPVRIVQDWDKTGKLNQGDPYVYLECIQTIFPIEGRPTPVSPGTEFTYMAPDIFGRPWAQIWEKYYEQNMQKPEEADIFSFE